MTYTASRKEIMDYDTLMAQLRQAQRDVQRTVLGSVEFRDAVKHRNAIAYRIMHTPRED